MNDAGAVWVQTPPVWVIMGAGLGRDEKWRLSQPSRVRVNTRCRLKSGIYPKTQTRSGTQIHPQISTSNQKIRVRHISGYLSRSAKLIGSIQLRVDKTGPQPCLQTKKKRPGRVTGPEAKGAAVTQKLRPTLTVTMVLVIFIFCSRTYVPRLDCPRLRATNSDSNVVTPTFPAPI